MQQANFSEAEVEKFENLSNSWWDPDGPCKPLHDLNPIRLHFVTMHCLLNQKQVLDIGCGGGILSESLAEKGAQVTGIDASPAMIETAQQHLFEQAVEYHHSTAEDWATQHPAHYDVITCMELLEHVPDPEQLLKACNKLLKPDGWLFLSTLNRTPHSFLKAIIGAEYLCRILPRGTHHYQDFIKPSELASSLRQAKFDMIDLKGLNYNPWLHQAKLTSNVKVNYLIAAKKKENL